VTSGDVDSGSGGAGPGLGTRRNRKEAEHPKTTGNTKERQRNGETPKPEKPKNSLSHGRVGKEGFRVTRKGEETFRKTESEESEEQERGKFPRMGGKCPRVERRTPKILQQQAATFSDRWTVDNGELRGGKKPQTTIDHVEGRGGCCTVGAAKESGAETARRGRKSSKRDGSAGGTDLFS